MKIACAQLQQEFDNPEKAFQLAETFLQNSDANLIIFPEQYATGWRPSPAKRDGRVIKEKWQSLAKRYRKYIIGSYYKPSVDTVENVLMVCSSDGQIVAEYVKMHPFTPGNERTKAGTVPVTFTIHDLKIGLSICFDLRYPDLYQQYLKEQCQIIIIQSAWPAARIADFELLLKARAVETRSFIIGANSIGCDMESNVDYGGRSMICDCEGKIIEDAGVFEGGCIWEFNPQELKDTVQNMRKSWYLQ